MLDLYQHIRAWIGHSPDVKQTFVWKRWGAAVFGFALALQPRSLTPPLPRLPRSPPLPEPILIFILHFY